MKTSDQAKWLFPRFIRNGIVLLLGLIHFLPGHALDADVTVTRFRTPDQAYIEIFLYVLGSSVKAAVHDSAQHASVNVIYFIESADSVKTVSGERVIVAGDRYNLVSTGVAGIADFMDLRRHFLEPGTYTLVVELTDNRDSTNTVTLNRSVVIEAPGASFLSSDIQLLGHAVVTSEKSVWVRNGVRMTPLPFAWYRADQNQLFFYQEFYYSNRTPGADFFIRYAIALPGDSSEILLQGYKRMKPKEVNTVVQSIDIGGLSSGEYVLDVSVFDQAKNLLSRADQAFVRSNPEADQKLALYQDRFFENSFVQAMPEDSVVYALKAIAPVIAQTQVPVLNYLLQKGEPENKKRFLHAYWVEEDQAQPEQAYRTFMTFARAVDKEYHSAFGYGFETDRGRIMMKYGIPDDMVAVADEPSAPPYEIWIYNDFPVTSQSNVRFLFYNPSLAGGDYRLLHSTAVGELQNSRWQQILYSDALSEPNSGDFIDARDVRDNFHRRAVEYFND